MARRRLGSSGTPSCAAGEALCPSQASVSFPEVLTRHSAARSPGAPPRAQVLKEGGTGSALISSLEMLRETVDNLVDG